MSGYDATGGNEQSLLIANNEASEGTVGSVILIGDGQIHGDLAGKVLGSGSGAITGLGVQAQLADGVAHGGTLGSSTATLALSHVTVTAPTGNAVECHSTGSSAVLLTGTVGLDIEATDTAVYVESANIGVNVQAISNALLLSSSADDGVLIGGAHSAINVISNDPIYPTVNVQHDNAGTAAKFISHSGSDTWKVCLADGNDSIGMNVSAAMINGTTAWVHMAQAYPNTTFATAFEAESFNAAGVESSIDMGQIGDTGGLAIQLFATDSAGANYVLGLFADGTTGAALELVGGNATVPTLYVHNDVANGTAAKFVSNSDAISVQSTVGWAINAGGAGGAYFHGTTSDGIAASSTSGHGISAGTSIGNAIDAVSEGAYGIHVIGTTGLAVSGGTASAVHLVGTTGGVEVTTSTGNALVLDSSAGSDEGVKIQAGSVGVSVVAHGSSSPGLLIQAGSGGHDVLLTGDGLIQGDLGGRILGNTATAFAGIGAEVTATLDSSERNSIADALLDRTDGIETGYTLRQALRLELAALAGKISGAETSTIHIRDINDSVDRILATVDASGNRLTVTKNVS